MKDNFWVSSLLYIIGVAALRLLPILLMPVIARIVQPSELGVLELALAYILAAQILATMSLEAATGRFFYNDEEIPDRRVVVTNCLFMVLVSSVIFAAAITFYAENLALLLFGSEQYADLVRYAAIYLVFGSIFNILTAVLRFLNEIFVFFAFNFSFIIVSISAILYYLYVAELGITGFVIGQSIGYVACTLSLALYLFSRGVITIDLSRPAMRRLLVYALPIVPGVLLMWITLHGTRALSSNILTAAEIGVLSIAMRMASVVKLGEEGLKMIWSPYVFRNISTPGHQADFAAKFFVISTGTFVLGAIVELIGYELYTLVLPEIYLSGFPVFCLLVTTFCLSSTIQLLLLGPSITKRTYLNSVIMCCGSAVSIAVVLSIVERVGIYAIPISMLLGSAVLVALSWIATERIYPIGFSVGRFLGALAVLLIANWIAIEFIAQPMVRYGAVFLAVAVGVVWLGLWHRSNRSTAH